VNRRPIGGIALAVTLDIEKQLVEGDSVFRRAHGEDMLSVQEGGWLFE
jgi:hypothetical protein